MENARTAIKKGRN